MALDFPNAPSPGEVFDNWEWDGTKWIPAPGAAGPLVPMAFIFPGAQWPQMQVNIPVVVGISIPENLEGSVYYNGTNATATTNTFQLNSIQGGASVQIGLVTVGTNGTAQFEGTGGTLVPGDVLQMSYPSATGDPTLADVGITILVDRS